MSLIVSSLAGCARLGSLAQHGLQGGAEGPRLGAVGAAEGAGELTVQGTHHVHRLVGDLDAAVGERELHGPGVGRGGRPADQPAPLLVVEGSMADDRCRKQPR